MKRPNAKLVPTAEHPAVLTDSLERWRSQSIRRELLLRFDDQLDDARNIDVEVIDDCVVLRGLVSCPLAKLLAEDLAYSIPEILDCYNVLSVARTSAALSA